MNLVQKDSYIIKQNPDFVKPRIVKRGWLGRVSPYGGGKEGLPEWYRGAGASWVVPGLFLACSWLVPGLVRLVLLLYPPPLGEGRF
jgi:hypothetical protein